MLSVFPGVLYIGAAFAPFVVRLLVAFAVGSLAHRHLTHRKEFAGVVGWFAKGYAVEFVTIASVIEAIIAALLLIGLYTQIAALLAVVIFVKILLLKNVYKQFAPESRTFYTYLLILSLLVFLAGAGPFAFDIPL